MIILDIDYNYAFIHIFWHKNAQFCQFKMEIKFWKQMECKRDWWAQMHMHKNDWVKSTSETYLGIAGRV